MELVDKYADSARKNFTYREKAVLFTILEKYKHVIESKETTREIIKQKQETWERIAEEYSANTSVTTPRYCHQLINLYKNVKSKFKKDKAEGNILEYIERERLLKSRDQDESELTSTDLGSRKLLAVPCDCNSYTEDFFPPHESNDGRIEVEVVINEQPDIDSKTSSDDDDVVTRQLPATPESVSPELSSCKPRLKRKKIGRITEDSTKRKIFINQLRAAELEKKQMEIINKTVLIKKQISEINLRKAQLEMEIFEKELAAREQALLVNKEN